MNTQHAKKNESLVENSMNTQLSNWFILYSKLHRFHWYVKGPHFFTLHEKFEELYDQAAETADTIAERLLAIGGQPAATLNSYLTLASISDEGSEKTASEMVQTLINDYKQISSESKFVIGIAEEQNDPSTADLFVGLAEEADKHVWMLSAYLGE
ncbi:DNA starvation/stationary phase protection protein [Bacillus sp. ISL-51]|uniref:Dps family protein n=1 Tax=Bacteria TaxID=2 RepID=UPI001BE709E6|nr:MULTISPECIES: Dps family protein [Bacteria]MBT2574765.1 DNA starvation/stationary phase protection protein [Bacillus sp. ISL-51]MBT2635644.1 DNA starvation/stationary phase protection protein [Bacillus sp. ISL-26]MBT2714280.1 DNA starvation/stationary phase protection protein [Pseudomonas sp. ISL-88]